MDTSTLQNKYPRHYRLTVKSASTLSILSDDVLTSLPLWAQRFEHILVMERFVTMTYQIGDEITTIRVMSDEDIEAHDDWLSEASLRDAESGAAYERYLNVYAGYDIQEVAAYLNSYNDSEGEKS